MYLLFRQIFHEFHLRKIYNLLGKEVVTLVDDMREANRYTQPFDAHAFASGIYFYKLQAGAYFSQTKKMLILK